jgi:hypothetical protein
MLSAPQHCFSRSGTVLVKLFDMSVLLLKLCDGFGRTSGIFEVIAAFKRTDLYTFKVVLKESRSGFYIPMR